MRNYIQCVLLFMLLIKILPGQIPNASFENWNNNNPIDWFTSNLLDIYIPITLTTDAHNGSSAVQGNVIPSLTGPAYSPSLVAGTTALGFPLDFRPAALHGWYKFTSEGGDALSVTIALTKNHKPVGAGILYSAESHTEYTEFIVNIPNPPEDIPDTADIVIIISNNPSVHIGSKFTLDNLSFGPATEIKESQLEKLNCFVLNQNYPNPFNPTTKIKYTIPMVRTSLMRFVQLKVYDVLGSEIAVLVNEEKPAGNYEVNFNASQLSAGIYFYCLLVNPAEGEAGSFIETKKMILLR